MTDSEKQKQAEIVLSLAELNWLLSALQAPIPPGINIAKKYQTNETCPQLDAILHQVLLARGLVFLDSHGIFHAVPLLRAILAIIANPVQVAVIARLSRESSGTQIYFHRVPEGITRHQRVDHELYAFSLSPEGDMGLQQVKQWFTSDDEIKPKDTKYTLPKGSIIQAQQAAQETLESGIKILTKLNVSSEEARSFLQTSIAHHSSKIVVQIIPDAKEPTVQQKYMIFSDQGSNWLLTEGNPAQQMLHLQQMTYEQLSDLLTTIYQHLFNSLQNPDEAN